MFVAFLFVGAGNFVYAQDSQDLGTGIVNKLNATRENSLLSNLSLAQVIGGVIQTALGIIGTIAVIYIIYGGVIWMGAEGNDEKLKRAATMMTNALIGLVIIMSAYALTAFVVSQLQKAATQPKSSQSIQHVA